MMLFATRTVSVILLLSIVVVGSIIGCCDGSSSRDRITQFVDEGQQFLVVSGVTLQEDPTKDEIQFDGVESAIIFWFCTPAYTPDDNGDEQYDNVVSHVLSYRPPNIVSQMRDAEASFTSFLTPHGYTAAWNEKEDKYEEFIVDFDDKTTTKLTETKDGVASVNYMEFSFAGETGGFVGSGEGIWEFNTTEIIELVGMADNLAKELTPENCENIYADNWKVSMEFGDEDFDEEEEDEEMLVTQEGTTSAATQNKDTIPLGAVAFSPYLLVSFLMIFI